MKSQASSEALNPKACKLKTALAPVNSQLAVERDTCSKCSRCSWCIGGFLEDE